MPLIELKNISFSYDTKKTNSKSSFFLTEVNLTLNKGEFVSILGQNGSGKSTLMKIVGGLLKPTVGSQLLKGKPYSSFSRRMMAKSIAFVPQASYTIFPFSVYEIVMMGRTPYLNMLGYEKGDDRRIVLEALEMVGIEHLKNKGINEVSGGEAQRAFIARAIVQEPELILLDEANSHLDIKHQISIFNLISRLNKERNMTVMAISHDLNLAGHYSERVVLMQSGKVFRDGPVHEILTEDNITAVFDVKAVVNREDSGAISGITVRPN